MGQNGSIILRKDEEFVGVLSMTASV